MHELHSLGGWLLDHVQDPGSVALTSLQITSLSTIPGDLSGSIELHLSDSKFWIPVLVALPEIETLCTKLHTQDATALIFSLVEVERIELKQVSSALRLVASGLSMRRIGEYDLTLGSPTPLRETSEWKVVEDEWLMRNAPYKFSEFKGCVPAEQAFPVRMLPFATLLMVDTLIEDILPEMLLDDTEEGEPLPSPPVRAPSQPRPPAQIITHDNTPDSSQGELDRSVSQGPSQTSAPRRSTRSTLSSQPSRTSSANLTQESAPSQKSKKSAPSKRQQSDPPKAFDPSKLTAEGLLTLSGKEAKQATKYFRDKLMFGGLERRDVEADEPSQPLAASSQHSHAIPPPSQRFPEDEEIDDEIVQSSQGTQQLDLPASPSAHSDDDFEESEESEELPAPPKKKSRMVMFGGMGDNSEESSEESDESENSPGPARALPNARKHTFQPYANTKPKAIPTQDVRKRNQHEMDSLDDDDLPPRKTSAKSRAVKR